MSEPTPNLNKALSQLQGELPRIAKTKTAKIEGTTRDGKPYSYPYSYADLGDVVADIGPLLARHGLAFHCGPTISPADRREMILIWSLLHESGEEKTGEWPLGPVNQKPQSLGSAITYGRRYSFTAATNIVLEDDDDGQRAQQDHGKRESAGDAFESATAARPRNQGPEPSRHAAGEVTASEDAQIFADAAAQATLPHEIEDIHRRAREAGMLTAAIQNRATGRTGQLAFYLDWRRSQVKAANTFEHAVALLGDSPWADSIRDLPDAEQARKLLAEAETVDMDAAKRPLIRNAILIRFPQADEASEAAA